jgi:phosphate uptake regulator
MRRNIIKQGNNSFTVTVPIEWIRENNIKGGDEVDIKEEDNSVILSLLERKPLATSIVVNLKKYSERSIKNIIFQLYRKGYDKISCSVGNCEQRDLLKKIVRNNLLGFEVVSEDNEKCVIENVAEPSKDKFSSLLNKLFFIIKTNAEEIINDLKQGNLAKLEKHTETKNVFDIYTNFLRRVVIKDKIGGNKDSYLLFYFVSQLSYVQHSFYYSYDYCVKNKIKIDKDSLNYIEQLNKTVNTLHESFANKDLDKAHMLGEEYLKMNKEIMACTDKPRVKNRSIIYHVLIGLRFVHLASTVIFGLNEYESTDQNLL